MAHSEIRLSVAEERTIYDVAAIDRAMEEAAGNRNEALATLYDKMKQRGGGRFLIRPTGADMIDDLYDTCPNFSDVIDDLKKYVALSVAGNEPMSFTPILLLGEPGIGKTHFARELANRLGTGHEFISMSSLTAGWVLSGASAQWNNAKPGKVAHTLVHGDYANPIVVLDEIDKAGGDSRYDPMGSLYGLLEHDTAGSFTDEFAEVAIDASQVIWVATANDGRAIPDPILNRMNVYEVQAPDQDAARRIAARLYCSIRADHGWGDRFEAEPRDEVLDAMSEMAPREMRRAWMTGFGNAKLDRRDHVQTRDLPDTRGKRGSIGFVQ